MDECIKRCISNEHAVRIISTLTKRDVSDSEICSYLNYICEFCGSARNSLGITALHMAASCGRTDACRWLVCCKQSKINERDGESGYTALHRSLYAGKIHTAVTLIRLGANMHICDFDSLTPLDHLVQDNRHMFNSYQTKIIVQAWGTNMNWSLGSTEERISPEVFEIFHKKVLKENVKETYISKYHTVIISNEGNAYSCGYGLGGRLGSGTEKTILEPKLVKFKRSQSVRSAAISQDHTLFLTNSNQVWSCGYSANNVLGFEMTPMPEHILEPHLVKMPNSCLDGVACGQYHSVAWGRKCLYTWGRNGGQMGHRQVMHQIPTPRLVKFDSDIQLVTASDGATAILSTDGKIHILHEYLCREIASHLPLSISISIFGGNLDLHGVKSDELKVAVINRGMYFWKASDRRLRRCVYNISREFVITYVQLYRKGLVLTTSDGEVYLGSITSPTPWTNGAGVKTVKDFCNFLDKSECVKVMMERVRRIYNAQKVHCDMDGNNFLAVQRQISFPLLQSHHDKIYADFTELQQDEFLADVCVKVKDQTFKAHKIFLFSASDVLAKQIGEARSVQIDDIEPEIFKRILDYIYRHNCDLLMRDRVPPDLKHCSTSPYLLLQRAAEKLQLKELVEQINMFFKQYLDMEILSFSHNMHKLNRFQDVIIRCKNGELLQAHKAILSARCDFFKSLFSFRWDKTEKVIPLLEFTQDCLEHFLLFLYNGNVDEKIAFTTLCDLFILADHLLVFDLMGICEMLLTQHITRKTFVQILLIAHTYNGTTLKEVVFEYICCNLPLLLEMYQLDQLPDDLLIELSDFYQKWNDTMNFRIITPFTHAVSDNQLALIANNNVIDMSFDDVIKTTPNTRTPRTRHRSRKISATKESSEVISEPEQSSLLQNQSLDDSTDEVESGSGPDTSGNVERVRKRLDAITNIDDDEYPILGERGGAVNIKDYLKTFRSKHQKSRMSQKEKKKLAMQQAAAQSSPTPTMESPKNPWKTLEPIEISPITTKKPVMSDIIREQKVQKEITKKMQSVKLEYMQLEAKAMDDLRKFYNADEVSDEIIVVERVVVDVPSTPTWVVKK